MNHSELAGGCNVIVLKFWSSCCWSKEGDAVELKAGEPQGGGEFMDGEPQGGGEFMAG